MRGVRSSVFTALATLFGASGISSALAAPSNHSQAIEIHGGEMSGPIASYVSSVGRRVARQAGRPEIRFSLVKTTVQRPSGELITAAANPEGVVIAAPALAYLNDEAQLACVLGHEIGHIVAGHTDPDNAKAVGIRESEADRLGLRYMAAAGYDPAACLELSKSWGEEVVTDERLGWGREYDGSIEKAASALQRAKSTARFGRGERSKDRLLAAIDGMFVWSRADGGVKEGKFVHPDIGVEFEVPAGYEVHNGAAAVRLGGAGGALIFTGSTYEGSREAFIAERLQDLTKALGRLPPVVFGEAVYNDIPATYAGITVESRLARPLFNVGPFTLSGNGFLRFMVYQWDKDRLFYFVTYTPSGWGPFETAVRSLRRLTRKEANEHRDQIVKIITVEPGESLHSIQRRGVQSMEHFLWSNGLNPSETLRPRQKLKLIIEVEG